MVEEGLGGGGDRFHRLAERLRVMRGRARNPLTFLTYCSAAARTSASVTCSAYGSRKVLMLRHMTTTVRNNRPARRHPAGDDPPGR